MEDYFFKVRKMTVGYGGRPLLRDIDVRLKRGEILTLIGPNGSGKSTILKSVIGQLPLLAGTVFLDGDVLNKMPERELAKRLSAVWTERVRPELMTVREAVSTGRLPYTGRLGILSDDDKKIVADTMETVGITELAEREFLTLSDGQRQRVMLARAIAQEPAVMILDEPTSYLDIRCKLEFLSLLQKLAREKEMAILMSLHELDLAERISDKLLCVKEGCIARIGAPEEVFVPGFIDRLYGLTEGSYDERTGRAELEKAAGEPRVFVIAGGGSGTPVYRRLQREGVPFSSGILWENDLDAPAAFALAARVVSVPAFARIGEKAYLDAKEEIARCARVINACSGFGELNRENEALYRYARELGKTGD